MAAHAALVFAGKSVAVPAISFLVTKAFSYLNAYCRYEGLEEVQRRLQQTMPKIQAVFDVVNPERIREQSAALDAWLWQLRDAAEETEDAVDMLKYYELKENAMDRKVSDWGSSFAKMKHKAVKTIKHSSIVHKSVKRLVHRGTLKRLREAVENLDRVAAGVADFLTLAEHLKTCTGQQEGHHLMSEGHETGSMLTATQVFGRDREKEQVMGWLTEVSDEDTEIVAVNSNNVSLVSVVAHGGMGKTTLAQLICKDSAVKKNFDKVIWVCVSTSFDAMTVISKVLQSATGRKPDVNTLEPLQQSLSENLSSVKYLLVLDDVWEDSKTDQWEKLFAPLRAGKNGSKILLTTRMQSVADLTTNLMGGDKKCLVLQGLEKNDTIKLFNHHAFSNISIQDYTHLQSTGEQIAKKVKGCPLVIKVLGAHLRDNRTIQYWNNFLHQSLERFEGNAEDIMKVLKLSYCHLPTELQTCFRYCSIFPQDYAFEMEDLVNMWICSGLISQDTAGTLSLSGIGEDYLVQLTRKSFFDLRSRVDATSNEESDYYVMHDLMHDLAKNISLGECARVVSVADFENMASTTRHLSVEYVDKLPMKEVQKICHLKHLRTIVIRKDSFWFKNEILNTVEEVVGNLKSLRLLKTELLHTSDFMGKLAKLKHLRYISLERVPRENSLYGIVKLYHLTVLSCDDKMFNIVKIEPKQVKDIGNLDRLRYVTYGSNGFGNIPIARLTSLRFLEHYQVQEAKGYTVSALKDLKSLHKLGISGLEYVENCKEAKDAKLKEKQHLISLSLGWSAHNGANSRQDLIFDNLEPNANLKNLKISGYTGATIPYWIANASVKNLVSLKLESCINWEQLPSLAEFLVLKYLRLDKLSKLKNIGEPCHASCTECVESTLPTCLYTLEVTQCPELRELPLLPLSLMAFKIRFTGLKKLPRMGKEPWNEKAGTRSAQLQEVIIIRCPCLTSLEGSFFEQKQHMGALSELRITQCTQLESALFEFDEMNGLRCLEISGCPKLRMLRNAREIVFPSSLRGLFMEPCGDLELALLRSLQVQQFTNLSQLDLKNCSCLLYLPSAEVFSRRFTSLKWISIKRCENLTSLGGLGSLSSLTRLDISCCAKLTETDSSQTALVSGGEEDHLMGSGSSLHITGLEIDLPSLLLVEPLKSLCHTKSLEIADASKMESFPDRWLLQNRASLRFLEIYKAESLESLPPCVSDLCSLQELQLHGARQLRSLPKLPSSLQKLEIDGVGQLLCSLPDLPTSLQILSITGECNTELMKNIRELKAMSEKRSPTSFESK